MSHPDPTHDFENERVEDSKFAPKKNSSSFPKEYVEARRGLRRTLSRINKTAGRAKALNKKKK